MFRPISSPPHDHEKDGREMHGPGFWARCWERQDDGEYECDLAMRAALVQHVDNGGVILDGVERSMLSGRSENAAVASFKRLFHSGVLRRIRFDPPRPSQYRVTDRPVRRAPLGGKRARGFARPDGGRWGCPPGALQIRNRDFSAVLDTQTSQAGMEGVAEFEVFLAKLHPRVAMFCRVLADGGDTEEAMAQSKLTREQVTIVLPKLRQKLSDAPFAVG